MMVDLPHTIRRKAVDPAIFYREREIVHRQMPAVLLGKMRDFDHRKRSFGLDFGRSPGLRWVYFSLQM